MLEQGIVSSRVTFSCYDLLRLSLCSVDLLYNITFLPPPPSPKQLIKTTKQQTPNPKPQRGLVGYLKNPAPEPSKRVSGSLGTLEATSGVFGLVHNLWTLGLGALRSSLSYFACSGKIGGSKCTLAPTCSEIPLGGPSQRALPPAKRSFCVHASCLLTP